MDSYINIVLGEITNTFSRSKLPIKALDLVIINSNTIVTSGAGRMGLVAKAFSMRLGHLGIRSYTLSDSTLPHLGTGDLLIVCSGSGETKSILVISEIAKKNGAKIALITCNSASSIARLSDVVIVIPAKTKLIENKVNSIQPMTTLMEQCTGIFFDAYILHLMKKMGIKEKKMWDKHSNLE